MDFFHTFSMALYHKWGVKTGLQFLMLISERLGAVACSRVHDNSDSFMQLDI